jgi:hypothetical protein
MYHLLDLFSSLSIAEISYDYGFLSTIIYHLLDLSSSLSIAEISYDYGLFFN